MVCSYILEARQDPIVGNPVLSQFLDAAEQWIAVQAKGGDATEELSNLRRIASFLFADSFELGSWPVTYDKKGLQWEFRQHQNLCRRRLVP